MTKVSTSPGASENGNSTVTAETPATSTESSTESPKTVKAVKAKVKPAAKKSVAKKPAAVKPAAKKAPVKPAKGKKSPAKRTVDNSNRDHSKVKVNGVVFTKGRAVLTMVKEIAAKKTLAELRTAFPDELIQNYGVIQPVKNIADAAKREKRFYMNKEDLITTKDGKTAAVCNQWNLSRIKSILPKAKSLGLTVSIVP